MPRYLGRAGLGSAIGIEAVPTLERLDANPNYLEATRQRFGDEPPPYYHSSTEEDEDGPPPTYQKTIAGIFPARSPKLSINHSTKRPSRPSLAPQFGSTSHEINSNENRVSKRRGLRSSHRPLDATPK